MNVLALPQRIIAYFLIAFIVLSQGVILYWAFWPYKPLEIECIKILEFRNGEYFVYRVKYAKHMDLPASISKQFVNGYTFTLPTTTSNYTVGRGESAHRVEIPQLPPGQYYFRLSATYKVNPIREVTVTARTPCFEIKAAEAHDGK